MEKSSGSLSMNGMMMFPCDLVKGVVFERVERRDLGPATSKVCGVVWKSCPPTLMVMILASDFFGENPDEGGVRPA